MGANTTGGTIFTVPMEKGGTVIAGELRRGIPAVAWGGGATGEGSGQIVDAHSFMADISYVQQVEAIQRKHGIHKLNRSA